VRDAVSATSTEIWLVVAYCCSTADAIAAVNWSISWTRPLMPPGGMDRALGRGLDLVDLGGDDVGRLGGLHRQRLDLGGNHRKALIGAPSRAIRWWR